MITVLVTILFSPSILADSEATTVKMYFSVFLKIKANFRTTNYITIINLVLPTYTLNISAKQISILLDFFWPLLLSCFFTISAEIWSLNGKITRTVSSGSLDGDKSCWWSQTFESTKLLMVELTRCLGYFKRENTVFKRSHSSEKCDQDEDKRCARSA